MTAVAIVLLLAGSSFCLLAAVGVFRFPELYTRLHAAAKAGPLGAGLILLGVAVASADVLVVVRSVLGLVFLIVVSPLSAHLLARAALLRAPSATNITSIKNIDDSRQG
jgi:multicomponent Na+:H+ antiporter subunit G